MSGQRIGRAGSGWGKRMSGWRRSVPGKALDAEVVGGDIHAFE